MIHSNHLLTLSAAMFFTVVTGCQISHHAKLPCNPTAPLSADSCSSGCSCHKHKFKGSVQVGGQFARSRVLPIPHCGLTLSEAIDQTIRDGVRASAGAAAMGFETPNTVSDGITQELIEKGHMNSFRDWADEEPEVKRKKAEDIFDSVYKNVLADPGTVRAVAVNNIIDFVNQANAGFKIGDNEIEFDKKVRNKITQMMDVFTAANTRTTDKQSTAPTTFPKTDLTYYQTAVRLRRNKGTYLVFPLWLVDRFQAGDVVLRDGDSIDVSNCNRSELYNRTVDSPISLKNYNVFSNNAAPEEARVLDRYIDLLRVSHDNRDGLTEEYYIPKNNNGAYGDNPGYNFMLDHAVVSSDDTVSLENLSLSTVIREGRREALQRSADLLKPQTASQAIEQGSESLDRKLSQVPIVGNICQLVESTTGFNTADAVSNTQSGIKNVFGLIPTP